MRDTQGKAWKGPKCKNTLPVELGYPTFLVHGSVHQPGSPLHPYFWHFMEASSYRHDQSLTPFLVPPPLAVGGGRAEMSKLLIMACSFS